MIIETKFNFRDKVWKIWRNCRKKWVPCPFCGESGTITGSDGSQRACPECYGRKGESLNDVMEWEVDKELEIGQIRVEHTREYTDNESRYDNYGVQAEKRVEQYMCYETGIGSGTLHSAHDLFPTKEEAQAECDGRNKEKK